MGARLGAALPNHEPAETGRDQGDGKGIRLHLIAQGAHELGAAMAACIGEGLIDHLTRRHAAAQLV